MVIKMKRSSFDEGILFGLGGKGFVFLILIVGFMTGVVIGGDSEGVLNMTEELRDVEDLCIDVKCGVSEMNCLDGYIVSCDNICDSNDGVCIDCVLDCSEYEQENVSDGVVSTPAPKDTIDLSPALDLEISDLGSVFRGEIVEIQARVSVSGARVENVSFNWVFSENFEVVSGEVVSECGSLNVGKSCESVIEVEVLGSSLLGEDEINVKVGYEYGE